MAVWWAAIALLFAVTAWTETRRLRIAAKPDIVSVERSAIRPPPAAIELVRELEAAGYTRTGTWLYRAIPTNRGRYSIREVFQDAARLLDVVVVTERAPTTLPVRVHVVSRGQGGEVVETNCLDGSFPVVAIPGESARRLPGVASALELVAMHHAHLAETGVAAVELDRAGYAERLARAHERETAAFVAAGRLRRVEGGFVLAPWPALRNIPGELALGLEARPLIARLSVLVLAVLGMLSATWICGLPALSAWILSIGLLALLAVSTAAWAPKTAFLAWSYPCTPVALVLDAGGVHSWVPWVVAIVASFFVLAYTQPTATKREDLIEEEIALGLRPPPSPEEQARATARRAPAAPPWRPAVPHVVFALAVFATLSVANVVAPVWLWPFVPWDRPSVAFRFVVSFAKPAVASAALNAVALALLARLGERRGVVPNFFVLFAVAALTQTGEIANRILVPMLARGSFERLPELLLGWVFTVKGYVLASSRGFGFLLVLRGQDRWWAGAALALAFLMPLLLEGVPLYRRMGADFGGAIFVIPGMVTVLLPIFVRATRWVFETSGIYTDDGSPAGGSPADVPPVAGR